MTSLELLHLLAYIPLIGLCILVSIIWKESHPNNPTKGGKKSQNKS